MTFHHSNFLADTDALRYRAYVFKSASQITAHITGYECRESGPKYSAIQ